MDLFSRSLPTIEGKCRVKVVGESNYQPALLSVVGIERVDGRVLLECSADLKPEPSNPYDSNAIRVEIERERVGYLSRDDAVAYASVVGRGVRCPAVIAGGGDDLSHQMLGVSLWLPAAE